MTAAADIKAAVIACGTNEKSSGAWPPPASQYAGTAAAMAPGNRCGTRWPLAASRMKTVSSSRSPYPSMRDVST